MSGSWLRTRLASLILAGSACATEAEEAAPAPAPEQACQTVPSVTWDNWAHGFFLTYCQACHASTAGNRHGAPGGSVFDTEADTLAQVDAVRRRVLEVGDMPVGGGVYADDLTLLEAWLSCTP